jgi:hypothetical protein
MAANGSHTINHSGSQIAARKGVLKMDKRVTVRLNNDDYKKLEKCAEKAGATMAETLREAWKRESGQDELVQKLDELENRITERINQRFDHVVKILGIIGKKVEWLVARLQIERQ